jgi:hypothetical protein
VFPGGGVIVDLTIKTTYLFQVADLIEKLENDTVTSVLMPPHLLGMARGDGSQDLPPLSSDTHTEKKSRVTTQGSNYTFNYKNGRRLKCPSFHRVKSFFPHFPECMSSHVFYSLFFTSQRERTSYRSTSSTGTIREVSLPPSLSNNG